MVGMYLKHRYGGDVVTIGHLFAAENIQHGAPGTRAGDGTLEADLAQLPDRYLLLDLRTAPPPVAADLRKPREMFGVPPFNTTIPAEAYDAIFFSREVGPAVPPREGA